MHDAATVERRLPGLSWREVWRYTMMTVGFLPDGKVHEKAQPCGSTRGTASTTRGASAVEVCYTERTKSVTLVLGPYMRVAFGRRADEGGLCIA